MARATSWTSLLWPFLVIIARVVLGVAILGSL
jgi:hypothetical protein